MPFDWRDRLDSENLQQRFPDGAVGYAAWFELIGSFFRPGADFEASGYLSLFDDFLAAATRAYLEYRETRRPECRVFVSHQQKDVKWAERVAYLATKHDLDYWLDVHDPTLAAVPSGDPRYGILIAAIVEMALLNCTHVVALHTENSSHSRWVPYEFGRAKARRIVSTQACGWFHPKVDPSQIGQEYVYLAWIAHGGECELKNWFKFQKQPVFVAGTQQPRCQTSGVQWPPERAEPDELPKTKKK